MVVFGAFGLLGGGRTGGLHYLTSLLGEIYSSLLNGCKSANTQFLYLAVSLSSPVYRYRPSIWLAFAFPSVGLNGQNPNIINKQIIFVVLSHLFLLMVIMSACLLKSFPLDGFLLSRLL